MLEQVGGSAMPEQVEEVAMIEALSRSRSRLRAVVMPEGLSRSG
ncbi:Kynureninase [Venturia inaequalis]|nr:Kynureninase [Venturia inaequalis]